MRAISMPLAAFQHGYSDGSLGLYFIEQIGNTPRFTAYSEKGIEYCGSIVKDRVILVPTGGM